MQQQQQELCDTEAVLWGMSSSVITGSLEQNQSSYLSYLPPPCFLCLSPCLLLSVLLCLCLSLCHTHTHSPASPIFLSTPTLSHTSKAPSSHLLVYSNTLQLLTLTITFSLESGDAHSIPTVRYMLVRAFRPWR